MKLFRTIVAFFSVAVLLSACQQQETKPVHDSQGQVVTLDQHAGKLLIVNYWASWCGSCKEEIPELNQFYKHHQKDVVLYGYEFDHLPAAELNKLVKQHGIDYPQFLDDPTKALKLDPVEGLPVTFVFDDKNQLVEKLEGPQTEASLDKVLKTHQGSTAAH